MTLALNSALYHGTVIHHRLAPKRHRLKYSVFSWLIDLDELPDLDRYLRLFSWNGANLFSFHDRDHGARSGEALKDYAQRLCAEAGSEDMIEKVFLLCYPRLWGYSFNPLSVYFCYRADGEMAACIYEVRNTFGESHSYVMPAIRPGVIRHSCNKTFYVSPFLPMEARYQFHIRPPGETVTLGICHEAEDGAKLTAVFAGTRQPLGDRHLLTALAGNPMMTVKVMAGIHWEALKMWRKGFAFHARPAPPETPYTVISTRDIAGK
ncbi:DUF1365 domain-containing protein [Aestuariispira insulae]|uniref:DUF1365 family protein n=1 Tax=Aestuariispira insulae TaxID=1461337 RepID=A0A3D9H8G5_9PROT|nr:DUF1365 domain-containing protein [Aestuariispira insulae]RED45790.1 hypothetical protein DFP90_11137 [Aestuariispira insulae]